jgi:hypothetical protein
MDVGQREGVVSRVQFRVLNGRDGIISIHRRLGYLYGDRALLGDALYELQNTFTVPQRISSFSTLLRGKHGQVFARRGRVV